MEPAFARRTVPELLSLVIMVSRAALYFLIRGRLPRRIAMDRGARIRGIENLKLDGWAKIGAYALVDARYTVELRLGRNFSLGDFSILRCSGAASFLCPGVTIADNVSFGPFCNIGGGYGLMIGANNLFGPYVSIHPETHVVDDLSLPIRRQGITGQGIRIGADNWFGAKSTVLDGSALGSQNIVAAGALLVNAQYGSRTILGGLPARKLAER
ncbi:acyltransferase [Sphingomonas sp. IC-56]|uniref:acyltransferase n=1 Tax=Sphingomonas sp. IC-56 TaxID=2898529 RepID=UPI001E44182E|nr:acyltransferase [Sphingomonas sp. IC-56]MCD2323313.1 acyltransferase [Sphingomonas sp. IC-56]